MNITIGSSVQLHPATGRWMRGDRYGIVVKRGRTVCGNRAWWVKMDRSGETVRVVEANLIDLSI